MVRIGKRAAALGAALQAAGLEPASLAPPRPRLLDLAGPLVGELLSVYRRLGGVQATPTLRPGAWDLVLEGSLVVELDEELHFNRYRALTLAASWETDLPWTADYTSYCEDGESQCTAAGSWGKRWTSPSCEWMFGAAGPPGQVTEPGAPRWKQRALYDAMKDLTPRVNLGVRMARVSVHDTVEGHRLGDVLEHIASASPSAIRALVESRVA